MIKVRVGQVWTCSEGESTVLSVDDMGTCYWSKTKFDYSSPTQMKNWHFVPQNDLEWLAVNEDEWCETIRFNAPGDGCCSRKQWQNMRYHLGLDKKPHYRLTGGEWVKQCKT